MNTTSAWIRPFTLFALVAALTATACERRYTSHSGGYGYGGGDDGQVSAGGYTGVVGSVAEWASNMNEFPAGTSPGLDPNMLFLEIGNYGPACGGAFAPECAVGVHWQTTIGLPPAMQVPGSYPIQGSGIVAATNAMGGTEESVDEEICWVSAGEYVDGTIEVVSNDGVTIVVRIQITSDVSAYDPTGEYAVPICD